MKEVLHEISSISVPGDSLTQLEEVIAEFEDVELIKHTWKRLAWVVFEVERPFLRSSKS